MTMNKETIKKINEVYGLYNTTSAIHDLRIETSFDEISILNKNWEIDKLNNLSNLIEDLTKLRDIIEEETGIRF